MKKTYFAPEIKVVTIQTAGMLAGSFNLNSETVEGSAALSRKGGGFWDDDEDEDF